MSNASPRKSHSARLPGFSRSTQRRNIRTHILWHPATPGARGRLCADRFTASGLRGGGCAGSFGGWCAGLWVLRGDVRGGLTLSTVAKKPKNAFVGLLINLQKRLLPGSPLDDPDVIDKEIFLIPFFTGNFFENFEFFELVHQIICGLVTDAKR